MNSVTLYSVKNLGWYSQCELRGSTADTS